MRAKTVNEDFKRGQEPLKALGLSYGSKLNTLAWKILEFIGSKGKEGASFTEIQKFAWLRTHPDKTEKDFYEKEEPTKWNPKPSRKTRGYFSVELLSWEGGGRKGLLSFCHKNEKGKWVLDRMPKPGENLVAEAMNFECGLDQRKDESENN